MNHVDCAGFDPVWFSTTTEDGYAIQIKETKGASALEASGDIPEVEKEVRDEDSPKEEA